MGGLLRAGLAAHSRLRWAGLPGAVRRSSGAAISSAEILVNALRRSPPSNAREALDRIAEARAIKSGAYLGAIVRAMAAAGAPGQLEAHFATPALCESLINAAAATTVDPQGAARSVDPQTVAWLLRTAQQRGWALDPEVLRDAAVYLADASHCAAGDPRSTGDLVEASLAAARALVDRGVPKGSSRLYRSVARALSAHGRASDAEWLLATARAAEGSEHMGDVVGSTMAMYYRLGDAAKAEALLDSFSSTWAAAWARLAPLQVTPDRAAHEAEKWRLTHEEGADDAGARLVLAEDLRRACSRAAAPFFQRALELARTRRPDDAVAFMGSSAHTHHVAFSHAQLDALVQALLDGRFVDQAYALCMDFRRDENAAGGRGVTAQQVVYGAALSSAALGGVVAELGAAGDWTRIWSLIDGAKGAATQGELAGRTWALLERALAGGDSRQAIRCAQHMAEIASGDSAAVEALTDDQIDAVLRQALALKTQAAGRPHPVVGLVSALLHTDFSSHGPALREWNSRLAARAAMAVAAAAPPDAAGIQDGIRAAVQSAEPAAVSAQASAPEAARTGPGPGPAHEPDEAEEDRLDLDADEISSRGAASPGPAAGCTGAGPGKAHSNKAGGASLEELRRQYNGYRQHGEVPPITLTTRLVVGAVNRAERGIWVPIVRDHMPEYLARLPKSQTPNGPSAAEYRQYIWSCAIYAHALLGEVEEAISYFQRIVDANSYPTGSASAALLACLAMQQQPIPVIPRGWSKPKGMLFKMEPTEPPRGESPSDRFIIPKGQRHRYRLVAEAGLGMLYASLYHLAWPSTYFFCVLLTALGRAGMIDEMRHVFASVVPCVQRRLPPKYRAHPNHSPSPVMWSCYIKAACVNGESTLAEQAFAQYRMSAMPALRESSSAYSRFVSGRFPAHMRLFALAWPYYNVVRMTRPLLEDGTQPVPWYDLQGVEKQLELDRLRALDKLPLPPRGAGVMLRIYTLVDEHRNMDSAESVVKEIRAMHEDRSLPRSIVARNPAKTVVYYKWMVLGYVAQLQAQRLEPDILRSAIKHTHDRILYWCEEWDASFKKCGAVLGASSHMDLDAGVLDLVRRIQETR